MAHNIMPTMVMSSFIDRVPRKAFSYLVYSTVVFTPERALSYGIVSDVVPADKLEEAVKSTTDMILNAPMPAIQGFDGSLMMMSYMRFQELPPACWTCEPPKNGWLL